MVGFEYRRTCPLKFGSFLVFIASVFLIGSAGASHVPDWNSYIAGNTVPGVGVALVLIPPGLHTASKYHGPM
jgi:hypothetical protein